MFGFRMPSSSRRHKARWHGASRTAVVVVSGDGWPTGPRACLFLARDEIADTSRPRGRAEIRGRGGALLGERLSLASEQFFLRLTGLVMLTLSFSARDPIPDDNRDPDALGVRSST